MISVVCLGCGKLFDAFHSRIKRGYSLYCSVKCKYENQEKKFMNGENKTCVVCGKSFYVKGSRTNDRVTCSHECLGKYQQIRKRFICNGCGKEFYLRDSEIKQGRGAYCSRECQLKTYKGSGNPNWDGGIDSHQKYRSRKANLPATLSDDEWEDILKHYDYCCAYCGIKQSKSVVLNKEHVIPVALGGGYTKDNIVPSCRRCNSRKHARTPEQAGMTMIKDRI